MGCNYPDMILSPKRLITYIGMKRNLKQTLEIRDNASDPKVKLQAAAKANNCYKFILGITTNAA